MASPPRNKKGTAFQPMAAEALGLSIHPTSNEVQSSPPLAAVPNSMLATAAAASTSQPSSKRGSQIRQSSGGSGPLGPSALSQEVAPSSPEFHPPSPSHTASPPQASSNFSPSFQPQLQQSPSQMPTTGGTYGWTQNRIPAPTLNSNAATGPRLTSDSWVQPDSDVLIPPLQPKKQQIQSPPGPAVEEREEVLQHTPPRSNGDWTARGGGGTLADAMAQRTSPTAQLLQGNANGVRAGGVNANRPRARGPTQSSSPVMMQAVRQAALQNSPPQQPAQAAQVRGTPPSLHGLIAPNVNPPPPILPRANTENPAASAVAAGVRPLGGTPPNVNSYQRNNTTSPPGTRNPSTTMSSTSSPPYHTPMESLQGGTSYLSESSSYSALPFEYDQDEDDVRHRSPQQYYNNQPQPDPRNRTHIDSYRRDQDSPPPIHIRSVPNQASSSMPPPQPQVQPPQPQVQTQAVPRLGLYPSQPASAVSGTGSHIRAQPARSFPVVDEEVDDDVVAVPQQQPAARPQQTHSSSQPPPTTRWVSQSRERERQQSPEQVRAPSPPPAPPVQHPPIPLYSPQSVQAGQPAVLRDNSPRRDSSTPSPPAPLRINPDAGNRRPSEEDLEPAEPSSDSFTPKSPNVALPADHTYPYANNNFGRMGSHNRMPQPAPYSPIDAYSSYGGSLQHALFAMQMGGMPAPRGPLANFNNYGARDGFTSLSGAAAALTGKPESPYPAPPSNNNANGAANKHGPGGFAGGSADSGGSYNYDSSQSSQPWEGPEQISYADFVEWQRKMYSNRPDAPIPPTPQSYASPQQSTNQQGFGGDQRNGMNSNRENDGKGTQASNGHGYGNVPAYGNGYGPGAMLDPSMIPDRYIPSALSSYLSSPMMHNPFLPRFPAPQSLVSSPSHIPLDLGPAPIGGRRLHKKKSKRQLRGAGSGTSKGGASSSVPKTSSRLKESQKPPTPPPAEEFPRVDSTVPKDTSSEESDTDDTKKGGSIRKPAPPSGPVVSETEEEEDDDDEVWLDESSEDELDVEYHSRYIQNPSKRKRKWEQKWDTMVRLFQEIDRTTDSPMVLLAAPSTSPSPKTHVLISRAMVRNPGKYMPYAQTARQSFAEIAKMRRKEKADAAAAERARRAAGFEQQLAQIPFLGPRWDAGSADSGGRGSSSPGSAGFGPPLGGLEKLQDLPNLAAGGEDGLKQALSVALDSLKQMHIIYEQREERRREELERQRQEAAGLESLFRMMAIESAAGSSQGSGPAGAGSPASSSGVPTLSGKKSP